MDEFPSNDAFRAKTTFTGCYLQVPPLDYFIKAVAKPRQTEIQDLNGSRLVLKLSATLADRYDDWYVHQRDIINNEDRAAHNSLSDWIVCFHIIILSIFLISAL